MVKLKIPHNYIARNYQAPFWNSLKGGCKRIILIWHRRAGKDKTVLNAVIDAMTERVGVYYYIFPTYAQGKKVLWDGIDRDGFKFMQHFPAELIKKRNEVDMKIELINGSIFQIVGSDNFDSLRGTNPIMCVFSEYSYHNPACWDTFRPILKENGGTAVFVYTPNGKNHGYNLYQMALTEPTVWHVEKLSVADTGIITDADIEQERREGMTESMIRQEYYCSFEFVTLGEKVLPEYNPDLHQAKVRLNPMPNLDTYRFWDGGLHPACVIAQIQPNGRLFILDSLYGENMGMQQFIRAYVKPLLARRYIGCNVWHDIGDPTIATPDQSNNDLSAYKVIESELGTSFQGADNSWHNRRESLKQMFSTLVDGVPMVQLSAHDYFLQQSLAGGWHYRMDKDGHVVKDIPTKDQHSHIGDCVSYAAVHFFRQRIAKPVRTVTQIMAAYNARRRAYG